MKPYFTKQNVEEQAYYLWEKTNKNLSSKIGSNPINSIGKNMITRKYIEEQAYYHSLRNPNLSADECWQETLATINWDNLLYHQILDEDFIREFIYHLAIYEGLVISQKFSMNLIRDIAQHFTPVHWDDLPKYQELDDDFIIDNYKKSKRVFLVSELKAIINYQKLSQKTIDALLSERIGLIYSIIKNQLLSLEFVGKILADYESCLLDLAKYQPYPEFFKEIKSNKIVNPSDLIQLQTKSKEQKIQEMKDYAKEHNLEFDGEYLYAYREHDKLGRGIYNKTICYEEGKYYRDWHCDIDSRIQNSFGLGIFPFSTRNGDPVRLNTNVLVKVHVDDWGCAIYNSKKARVWAFTVLKVIPHQVDIVDGMYITKDNVDYNVLYEIIKQHVPYPIYREV